MTTRTIALTGVSGVGKSTLVRALSTAIPLEHLQASALIREGRNATGDMVTQDQLRLINLDENQRLLVAGFKLVTASKRGLVILDAHTVIEKGDELAPIDAAVFKAIKISAMIFLEDDPKAIAKRRRSDASRIRPLPNVDRLGQIQDFAREQAFMICHELGVDLLIYRPNQFAAISAALVGQSVDGG
ncbi:MAG TPA: AAA family ATPase [Methyloceanibacter sp.]|jgi:adenylate kinase